MPPFTCVYVTWLYSRVDPQADWIVPSHRPPLRWPQEGKIEATDFCLRYRDGPLVLRNINLVVHGGEKVGTVAGLPGSLNVEVAAQQ